LNFATRELLAELKQVLAQFVVETAGYPVAQKKEHFNHVWDGI
jgi:hypothetical protein